MSDGRIGDEFSRTGQVLSGACETASTGDIGNAGAEQVKTIEDAYKRYRESQKQERQYSDSFQKTLKFIDGLRARGVSKFVGLGLTLELGWMPDAGRALSTAPIEPPAIDLGGGLMVESEVAKDLFGHE